MDRQFQSQADIKKLVDDYVKDNKNNIIKHMLSALKYDTLDALREDEMKLPQFIGDCGVVYLIPHDKAMYKEWDKFDGDSRMYISVPYQSQSVIIKETQAEYILEQLNLDKVLFTYSIYT